LSNRAKTDVPEVVWTESRKYLGREFHGSTTQMLPRCSICVLLHACSYQPTTGACFTEI